MEAGGKISVIAESLNRPQAAVKQQWYKMRDGREVDEDAATGSGLNRGELMSSDAGQEKVSRKVRLCGTLHLLGSWVVLPVYSRG